MHKDPLQTCFKTWKKKTLLRIILDKPRQTEYYSKQRFVEKRLTFTVAFNNECMNNKQKLDKLKNTLNTLNSLKKFQNSEVQLLDTNTYPISLKCVYTCVSYKVLLYIIYKYSLNFRNFGVDVPDGWSCSTIWKWANCLEKGYSAVDWTNELPVTISHGLALNNQIVRRI